MKTIREAAHQTLQWTRCKAGGELRAGDELVAALIKEQPSIGQLSKLIKKKPFNACLAQSADGSWTFAEERDSVDFADFADFSNLLSLYLLALGFLVFIGFMLFIGFFGGDVPLLVLLAFLGFLALGLFVGFLNFLTHGCSSRVRVIEEGSGVEVAVYKNGKDRGLEFLLDGSSFHFADIGQQTWAFENEAAEPVVHFKPHYSYRLRKPWTWFRHPWHTATVEIEGTALSVPALTLLTLLGLYLLYFFKDGAATLSD